MKKRDNASRVQFKKSFNNPLSPPSPRDIYSCKSNFRGGELLGCGHEIKSYLTECKNQFQLALAFYSYVIFLFFFTKLLRKILPMFTLNLATINLIELWCSTLIVFKSTADDNIDVFIRFILKLKFCSFDFLLSDRVAQNIWLLVGALNLVTIDLIEPVRRKLRLFKWKVILEKFIRPFIRKLKR